MSSDMFGFPKRNFLGVLNINPDTFATSINIQNEVNTSTTGSLGSSSQNVAPGIQGYGSYDFQFRRTAPTMTSSGLFSAAYGRSNMSSGLCSFVTGTSAIASGVNSTAMGDSNTASGSGAMAFGASNSVTGTNCTGAGQECVSAGTASIAVGFRASASGTGSLASGSQSANFSVNGRHSHSSGQFSSVGDCQKSLFTIRAATTDATPTILTGDAGTATASNSVVLQNNNSMSFTGQIVVRQTASTVSSSWKFEGLIIRGTTAASAVLVTSTVTAISNATAIPLPAFTANTTLGSLVLTCTGVAATSFRWMCYVETAEVIYA